MHSTARPKARLFERAKNLSISRAFWALENWLFILSTFKIWPLFPVRNLGLFSRNKIGFQICFQMSRGNHDNSVKLQLEAYTQVAKSNPCFYQRPIKRPDFWIQVLPDLPNLLPGSALCFHYSALPQILQGFRVFFQISELNLILHLIGNWIRTSDHSIEKSKSD